MIDARARRDLISQWAFDSRPVLGRFHLWLEDVEERRVSGEPARDLSFVGTSPVSIRHLKRRRSSRTSSSAPLAITFANAAASAPAVGL